MRALAFALVLVLSSVAPVWAVELTLPGLADLVAEDRREGATVVLPTGPWRDGEIAVSEKDGTQTRRVWRLRNSDATTLQVIDRITEEIVAAGFTPVYRCNDAVCGGFDFRFALDLIGEPDMHVDLGNYRYFLAQSDTALISVVVSRTATDAFVHMTEVTEAEKASPLPVVTRAPSLDVIVQKGDLAASLAEAGRAPLPDLVFEAGSSRLGDRRFESLAELAGLLERDENARVILVGHTDADGSLEANIGLSKRRAVSVRQRLIDAYGADSTRIGAEGVGYLAPVASNDTVEGREANRRVEVILDR